jgi:simple sugar transport system ATP-binding protein
MMVGNLRAELPRRTSSAINSTSKIVACFRDVCVYPSSSHRTLSNVELEVLAGEVLGVAGVAGSGQDELAGVLTGHVVPDTGIVDFTASRPAAHVPANPIVTGSIQSLSLTDNLFLRDIDEPEYHWGPFLKKERFVPRRDSA